MIPCIPCETARELLEPFLDRELSTNEQVAVEAHLRWCRTCAAHVDDLALIGWSLRAGTPATSPVAEDSRALAIVQSDVLARVKAEQAESWRAWFVDLFPESSERSRVARIPELQNGGTRLAQPPAESTTR